MSAAGQSKGRRYTGAILTAGRGSRMRPLTNLCPKALLPIANRPLILRQIDSMRTLGMQDVVILIGEQGTEIVKVVGDGSAYGVSVRYVRQTCYAGLAHAVGLLEEHIEGPFFLVLGDIFFIPVDLASVFSIFETRRAGAVLATKMEPEPEALRKNFSVEALSDGTVQRVIEKPQFTVNCLKGVGLYLFSPEIFDAIRRTPLSALRNQCELTDAIQVMIDSGIGVQAANVIASDVNLTDPPDLLRSNLEMAEAAGDNIIGSGCHFHDGATLRRCVIGSNVVIEQPIRIEDSVVFSDTIVTSQPDLQGVVVTPSVIVNCRPRILAGTAAAGGI